MAGAKAIKQLLIERKMTVKSLAEKLGIEPEECTKDGRFSLTACRCIGACGLAPVLTINDEVYGRLAPEDMDEILAKYMN